MPGMPTVPRRARVACAIAVAVSAGGFASPHGPAARAAAAPAVQDVTVCGTVIAYVCDKPTETALLELAGPGLGEVRRVGVPAARRKAFGARFEEQLLGAEVCATGLLSVVGRQPCVVPAGPDALVVRKPAPRAAAPFAPGALPLCTVGVDMPVLTREVKPQYTPEAMRAKIQGSVALEAVVLSDGRVGDIRVMQSLDARYGLDLEAIRAARNWRFKPGRFRGEPVPVIVRIDLTFRLR